MIKRLKIDLFCLVVLSGLTLSGWNCLAQTEEEKIATYNFYAAEVERLYALDAEQSSAFIDSAVSQAKKISEQYYLADAFQLRGRQFFMSGEIDSALAYSKQACAIYQYYPDSIEYYISEYNLGNIYLAREEHIQALVQFKKVLRIIDQNFESYVKKNRGEIELNRAYCYFSIGLIYDELGDYELTLNNFRRGIKIAQKVSGRESETLQAIVLGNMGLAYCEIGNYEMAESYAIAGMEQKKKLGIENSIGYNYNVLARAGYGRKKYSLALKYLDLSDKYFKQIFNQEELSKNDLLRAKCYLGLDKRNEAKKLLQTIERQFDAPGNIDQRIEVNELLSQIFEEEGDFVSAGKYLKIALVLRKESSAKNDRKAIDEFLKFFEEEESRIDDKLENYKHIQEKEKLQLEIQAQEDKQIWIYSLFIVSTICLVLIILAIARGNRKSKRINQELSYSIDEKQILFKEVHHRVKNNFQIISSLLNLQQGIEEDQRSKKVLTDAQGRIQSMSLVHEMLYRKNEVKRIDFRTYTDELVSSIVRSFSIPASKIDHTISCNDESFDLELAVPLGLILNEAVTNSVKYAFTERESGLVEINLVKIADQTYQLTIRDNGIGIADEFITGTKETLGIELINILSEQLGGSAKFINNKGTEVRIVFNCAD